MIHPLPGEIVDVEFATAAVLARVEAVAVNAYTIARHAVMAGSFGPVPAAVAEYVDAALEHHQVALAAWNGVLTAGGRPAVTVAPVDLAAAVNEQLVAVTDGVGVAMVALNLETIASATYLDAVRTLVSEPAILLAGSILSIGRQHMSVLLFAVGQYPVPETFASAELAYVPTDS